MSKARILAQKVLYAAYHRLPVAEMSTWQTCQRCVPPDGSWWCFEPSHLRKCDKAHAAFHHSPKHPVPSEPNAVYVARTRNAPRKHRWALRPAESPGRPGKGKKGSPDLAAGNVGASPAPSRGPASPQLNGDEAGAEKTEMATDFSRSISGPDRDGAASDANPSEEDLDERRHGMAHKTTTTNENAGREGPVGINL